MKQVWPRLFSPRNPAASPEPWGGAAGHWQVRLPAGPSPAWVACFQLNLTLRDMISVGHFTSTALFQKLPRLASTSMSCQCRIRKTNHSQLSSIDGCMTSNLV